MPVCPILKHPHANLRRAALPVTEFDADLDALIENLCDTLKFAGGIGLSATQIDQHRRVLVIAPVHGQGIPHIYVNPEVKSKAAWGLVEESCLSVPGTSGNVFRATKIQVTAQDKNGTHFTCTLEGMDAVCLQHEVDHLDGKLFIDCLPFFEKARQHIWSLLKRNTPAFHNQ